MVGVLRAITAAALPVVAAATSAIAVASYSSSPQFPSKPLYSFSTPSFRSSSSPPSATVPMNAPPSQAKPYYQANAILPDLLTEFMVDMKCEGCVSAVKSSLAKIDGIKNVDVDLNNQVVRVLGPVPVKTMLDALSKTGQNARLIGQGNPNDFLVSAAVAEFKGPFLYGVVRIAQVNMELARIDASFSGLSPGKHGWSINEFGDLTRGAASTGKVFNPENHSSEKPLGDLGTLQANEAGEANYSDAKRMLRVADLIGRSIVVYETEDKLDSGIAAAVVARSAGVGENYKKVCTCDGVTIWESS